jgi:hypothetical protein
MSKNYKIALGFVVAKREVLGYNAFVRVRWEIGNCS